ncbi:hypothetical protein ASG67_07450 [Sphingomonas sp. Leaf339]|uniref:tryptophan 7-halogenase n=1 Tax=Sphingomonas sp. Leaf339 TaxID=1736343 RepID=UPI0006FAD0FA|nr:tryptophan 7-halogenase [Sphingomonas sp. Leaf339]KQU55922.1 hypothetical protein ASG67_07450 [Sphingomonas sp. Leaf339]
MSAALRSVAVFGGGIVAQSAALAFAKALPRAAIVQVATPVSPAALADRLPLVQPFALATFDRLGIDPDALIDRGVATHRLAQRFEAWGPDRRPWHLSDSGTAVPSGPGAPHQRWLEAERQGDTRPFDMLLPGAVLAQSGRFAPDLPPPLDMTEAALRLDGDAFARVLASGLARSRVTSRSGSIASVDRDADGHVAAVMMADGTRIVADLFIDATGPAALVAGDMAFEDWSAALPYDRLLLQRSGAGTTPLLDSYTATDIGWSARWPFPGGEWRALAFAATTREDRARRKLPSGRDTADLISYRPGRRRDAWRGNVLTLGEAAVQPGPLGLAGLSLAWTHLALALDLLPDRTMPPSLIAEYNRRAGLRADRLCDFLAAHYRGRNEAPAGLATTLVQFERRGLLPHHEEESMIDDAWAAVLLGQGMRPTRRDPQAMGAEPRAIAAAQTAITAAVARVPA